MTPADLFDRILIHASLHDVTELSARELTFGEIELRIGPDIEQAAGLERDLRGVLPKDIAISVVAVIRATAKKSATTSAETYWTQPYPRKLGVFREAIEVKEKRE